jgi:hypothetical protein
MKNFYSTGDNLSFLASEIVAPQHSTGDTYTNLVGPGEGATTPVNLVEDGDPCLIGRIVGVSNMDAVFATDLIVVSTRGVYSLPVKANYGAGIHVGETVYIDPVAATLSDNSAGVPFGVVVPPNGGTAGGVNAIAVPVGATNTVLVKLFGQTPGAVGFGS